MDTTEEQAPLEPKPKRKYKPRPICADPNLKYRYKPKPGPKPRNSTGRKRYKPVRTDVEQRKFSRRSFSEKKKLAANPALKEKWARHLVKENKANPARLSRLGIPDGMNRAQAEAAWAVARAQAEKVFTQMVDEGIVAGVVPEDFERVTLQKADGQTVVILVPKTDEGEAFSRIQGSNGDGPWADGQSADENQLPSTPFLSSPNRRPRRSLKSARRKTFWQQP
jgi:hypothetical protein